MKSFLQVAVTATVFFLGAHAFAEQASLTFSRADDLFVRRERNQDAIEQARRLYEEVLTSLSSSKEDKIYAMYQLGRLAYYQGELLTDDDNSAVRLPIFTRCLEDIENIRPSLVGENPTYYFFKSICMALAAKSMPWNSVAVKVREFKLVLDRGFSLYKDYEYGTFYVIYGHILVAKPILKLFGLYDPTRTIEYTNTAINNGTPYYNAYIIKAKALVELNRRHEAIVLLEDAIDNLEDNIKKGQLVRGYEPEAKAFLYVMKKALREL